MREHSAANHGTMRDQGAERIRTAGSSRSTDSRRKPLKQSELGRIEREWRHANATRSTPVDSWLNGYQHDVRLLLDEIARLREARS